jgi:hypothetical protein
MSRTDVHRPWDVQTRDPYNRYLLRWYRTIRVGGIWQMEPMFWRNIGCGCRMCTNYWCRKWERRQQRAQGRRYCRSRWYREYE